MNPAELESRYTLPAIDVVRDSVDEIATKQAEIRRLATERNAVILAHNYQRPEVQDVAHMVGDSLGLSREAARTEADVIVFCGVHFMAETAAVICPDRTVLLPTDETRGGCSLAASITLDELRTWKAAHPGAVVVAYVNTSAELKAEVDYCCTSGNAAAIVDSIDPDREILFLPDKFLAAVVARQTGRDNIIAWEGYCHVHRMIDPEDVVMLMRDREGLELLIHPECGCVSSCMQKTVDGELPQERVYFLSTEGMVRHIEASSSKTFAVGTEVGILHRLRSEFPEREFLPVNEGAVCAFMKTITLDSILETLRTMGPRVTVPAETAEAARQSIDRMLALG